MGNIGSQHGHLTQKQEPEEQWAHSFPRTQQRLYQQPKVLPDRDARQKLRPTNNGEILQSGGTLSGRHQRTLSLEYDGDFSEIPSSSKNNISSKSYSSNTKDALQKNHRFNQNFNTPKHKDAVKKFGSEPDLRMAGSEENKSRTRKKYKAPSPPKLSPTDKYEWDDSLIDGPAIRRTRLFKTRAETKKNYSSPVNNHKLLGKSSVEEIVDISNDNKYTESTPNKLFSEQKSGDNFHKELKEVTLRLRQSRACYEEDTYATDKLKTLDHNVNKKENIREHLKQIELGEEFNRISSIVRGDGSGKESSSPDQVSPAAPRKQNLNKIQPKSFYFGMEENVQQDYNNDILENFASNFNNLQITPQINSSVSDISSEIEIDEQNTRNSIDLQLRPILPKKQLEIPRFSPVAAWRLLSLDSNAAPSTITSDDVPVFIEERIEKFARPPPPTMQIGPRSNDKSGDSGISGDTGPAVFDDTPDVLLTSNNHLHSNNNGISWTPQQDLGDDSSMDEDHLDSGYKVSKYTNKPHVFSLSLPRDNQLAAYLDTNNSNMSMKKLKRSVSGVLGSLGNKKDYLPANQSQNENWFLSKSAPNSLNNGFNSLEMKTPNRSDNSKEQLLLNSISTNTSGRVMYLPELDDDYRPSRSNLKRDEIRERSRSVDRHFANNSPTLGYKSRKDIRNEFKFSSEPEDLQDPKSSENLDHRNWNMSKKKRFTFQSTVRQIERKRLADKLSREAEKKEKQRLRELEAMQRVEEEFQRKRAGEKATIKQQLRMFSMNEEDLNSSSNKELKIEARPEPDGAVSSSTTSSPSLVPIPKIKPKQVYQKNKKSSVNNRRRPSSESSEEIKPKPPITQILSEYRHPQREYKEYTGNARFLSEYENHSRQTTVHPQVTCNMPKVKGSKISGNNYRKNFAHGVMSGRSAAESTHSEDSQSRNNSPRMYHNKYAPITRF